VTRRFHDQEERETIAAYERGEFKPIRGQKAAKKAAIGAAKRYLRPPQGAKLTKDARINIRLSSADLEMLKRRAAQEGLPYQSLISSVLHKYAAGSGGEQKSV
jgi:predicted DNA binding CopG/RHH family protein